MEEVFKRDKVALRDLTEIAAALLEFFHDRRIFIFEGELGAGKTTLIKRLINALGSSDQGGSPSFGIVHEYLLTSGSAYHMDLYRINTSAELNEFGINEYLDSGCYCFIEWPEKVMERLPLADTVLVRIDYLAENLRCISANPL